MSLSLQLYWEMSNQSQSVTGRLHSQTHPIENMGKIGGGRREGSKGGATLRIQAAGMLYMPVKYWERAGCLGTMGDTVQRERERERERGLYEDGLLSLPARFDWSIMGCTILLLALMNLRKGRKTEDKHKVNHLQLSHSRGMQQYNTSIPQNTSKAVCFNGSIGHWLPVRGHPNNSICWSI